MPFSPNQDRRGLTCSLFFLCFSKPHFRSCLSNIFVCLWYDWNDQMSQWPSTGVLGHMGMYHKCFLSVLPNFEQCVKCILVAAKDTYGHWDVCQMECGEKEVLWFALEQVMTCWKEEVKAVWWVFKLASKWHGGFLSKVKIFVTWVFKKAFICSNQLFWSREPVLKASCLNPVMTRAASTGRWRCCCTVTVSTC